MALTPEQVARMFELTDANKTEEIISFTIDGNEISCYASYSFFHAKSYVKSPIRSSTGAIENLDSYSTFLTPRLRIKFSMMPLETYRTIMKLIQSKNEFTVTCYDIVWDKMISWKGYFSTEDYPELFVYDLHTLGAIGYEIELQGTNADLDYVNIVYHSNPPISSGLSDTTEGSIYIPIGQELKIGEGIEIPEMQIPGYKFKSWKTITGDVYFNDVYITLSNNIVLYAEWESTDMATLSYDYGLGEIATETDPDTGIVKQILSTQVQKNYSIGNLPSAKQRLYTKINDVDYITHVFNGWYKSPNINSERVISGMSYWTNANSTIYAIYQPVQNYLSYITGEGYIGLSSQLVPYNSQVSLPNLSKDGYTFVGWYDNATYEGNAITGIYTMPPYAVTLYAKWEIN